MTTFYRFAWGAYSDSDEEWFSHEGAMAPREVGDLLRAKWPEVRAEMVPLWEDYARQVEKARAEMDDGMKPKWPKEPPSPPHALLEAAGFVPLQCVNVDGDPLFDCWGDKIKQIDEQLPEMEKR